MSDHHDRPATGPATGVPAAPDADTVPPAEPLPIPGAAGPVGGSPTGDLVDGADQPVDLPGDRPPLSTD
jgi:hypothetical protein